MVAVVIECAKGQETSRSLPCLSLRRVPWLWDKRDAYPTARCGIGNATGNAERVAPDRWAHPTRR